MVTRLDFSRQKLDKFERTPTGGLRIPGFFARTGIQEYKDASGRVTREYRPDSEVFHAESLASYEDAVVTDDHPPELVTVDNWRQYARGFVKQAKQDGELVAGDLVITDAALIALIERGDRKEISVGYTVDLVPADGEFEGQRYDAVQTNIRVNHVALGPEGWGRAGSKVALRLDTNDAVAYTPETMESPNDLQEQLAGAHERFDRASKALDSVTKERDEYRGKVEALEAKLADTQSKLDSIDVAALVRDRVELETSARSVLGQEARFDGQSDDEIRKAVIAKACPEVKVDSASPEFLRGAYSIAISAPKGNLEQAREAVASVSVQAPELSAHERYVKHFVEKK